MIDVQAAQLFTEANNEWKAAALDLVEAESAYNRAWSLALIDAPGSNEAKRTATADLAANEQRVARDKARVVEQAARWRVQWLVNGAGADRRSPV